MHELDSVLATVPQPLRPGVALHWQRYCEACARDGIEPVAAGWHAALVRVWACSDFVAENCTRTPRLLAGLIAGEALAAPDMPGAIGGRVAAALADCSDEAVLSARLRTLRRREMVRIAWRDLSGAAKLTETLEDLSALADACVDAALTWLYDAASRRHGEPRDERGRAQRLVVLGMGKLGGRELNYSSDIDLIFAFPEHGSTAGPRPLENQEFFLRLAQKLIRVLDALTADGFVFRVDMRLRPFGDSGPLVASFAALETYYQSQGRDWERYAMIKARAIAGDLEAGERLLETLRPFVFRRYLDYGAFESLRNLKAMIAQEVERKGLQDNVKLGPGGIREIEFIGQAFQLIYGGREPPLRVRGIREVLERLADSRRLPEDAVDRLQHAYDCLRRTENRLQAWQDRQTHRLPEDDTGRLRLAFSMGFADWPAFRQTLDAHRSFVAERFAQVFALGREAPVAEGMAALAAVWHETVSREAAAARLAAAGYDHPPAALEALDRLRGSLAYRSMSAHGRERLDRLMPALLREAGNGPQPAVTLARLAPLLEAVARRSVYLALLHEKPVALGQLVALAGASPWIAEQLTRFPVLLDELLNPAVLYAPPGPEALAAEVRQMLSRVPEGDHEAHLLVLRQFKQINVLRVAAADVSGALPLMVVSDHLTAIAETLLHEALVQAWADVTVRHGLPRCVVDGVARTAGFAIIAYGKLGGLELGYGSDLDLVFLHDSAGEEQETDGERPLDNATFFARLAQRLIHVLTAPTGAGVLYEIDTRLRPSGRAGMMVASIDGYAAYQRAGAWTWEHQALVRARPVTGSAAIAERFCALRQEVLARVREPAVLRREVREMREKMREHLGSRNPAAFHLKQDRGGMADIEFIVQYLVLAHTAEEPILVRYTDNVRQLAALEATGILRSADANLLRDAYRQLRRRAHLAKLRDEPATITGNELKPYRDGVERLWQRIMEAED